MYVRYKYEEDAGKATENVNERFYDGNPYFFFKKCPDHSPKKDLNMAQKGRPIWAELSPVTDFSEACCRQFELSECNRGGFCNFMVFFNFLLGVIETPKLKIIKQQAR